MVVRHSSRHSILRRVCTSPLPVYAYTLYMGTPLSTARALTFYTGSTRPHFPVIHAYTPSSRPSPWISPPARVTSSALGAVSLPVPVFAASVREAYVDPIFGCTRAPGSSAVADKIKATAFCADADLRYFVMAIRRPARIFTKMDVGVDAAALFEYLVRLQWTHTYSFSGEIANTSSGIRRIGRTPRKLRVDCGREAGTKVMAHDLKLHFSRRCMYADC
ncbi:hypothetical protein HYPSUDRAFT_413337 [Hypholoma sublateritium FD-334 SS-4]|uniref:Uncharacterized protein n=1 Tax=Hypholoma sublateritium (strain FD-334 SS-4) TaxID=945553 RepID=A0A0D2LVJ5_HYPSF|nr:hypothetical protein HYPSUDRAFT_413337 [Hypholoma sublateritium FD-334 SS-4]